MINEERPSVRCYPHFPVFRHKFAILRIRKSEIRVTFSRGRSGGGFWVPGPFPHCTVRIVIDVISSPGSRVLALLPSWWEIVWWWLNFLSNFDFFEAGKNVLYFFSKFCDNHKIIVHWRYFQLKIGPTIVSKFQYPVIKSRRKTEKYDSLLHCTSDIWTLSFRN